MNLRVGFCVCILISPDLPSLQQKDQRARPGVLPSEILLQNKKWERKACKL